jgi:hypothetical protein
LNTAPFTNDDDPEQGSLKEWHFTALVLGVFLLLLLKALLAGAL